MKKVFFVFLVIILLPSCSWFNKSTKKPIAISDKLLNIKLLKLTAQKNISEQDFIFSKVKVSYQSYKKTTALKLYLKHKYNEAVLASIRPFAGFELARTLITSDSIFVYNRLKKELYYQDIEYVSKKYGIGSELLPLIWGDLPKVFLADNFDMQYTNSSCLFDYKDCEIRLTKSPSLDKLSEAIVDNNYGSLVKLEYSNFSVSDSLSFPQTVIVTVPEKKLKINLDLSGFAYQEISNMNLAPKSVKIRKILK